MAELDLITDWQGRHMQANNPNCPKCVCNLFFFVACLTTQKYLGSIREELIPLFEQQSKSSCTAAKAKALIQAGVAFGRPETSKNRKVFMFSLN